MSTIPGWFSPADMDIFDWILSDQLLFGVAGDLAELGAYLGRSAVLIGDYVRDGETFTVVDLFGANAEDEENLTENAQEYPNLTRADFERNYVRFHDRLPRVLEAPSSHVVLHAEPGRHRFVHVDASHLYAHVAADVVSARSLLRPNGVVVFDDIRSAHTPGVAAAVWGAVATQGLRPFLLSDRKLYGSWGDTGDLRERLAIRLQQSRWGVEEQTIHGYPVLRQFSLRPARGPAGRLVHGLPPAVRALGRRWGL